MKFTNAKKEATLLKHRRNPLKDVRAQNFPHTDFIKTLTAGRKI